MPYHIDALDHDFPYLNCSMRVIDADVRDVLRAFADKYELNIIMSEEVKGTISIIINEIPVKEAFKNILHYSDLGYIKEKNVYRIKSLQSLLKEKQLKKKPEVVKIEIVPLKHVNADRLAKNLTSFSSDSDEATISADKWTNSLIIKDKISNLENLKKIISQLDISTSVKGNEELEKGTKIIRLRYINCQDVAKIKNLKDKISTHPQSNSVIITDVPENIPHLASIIQDLDKPIRQILIEAKIVETKKRYFHSLGIQWGGYYSTRDRQSSGGGKFPTIIMEGSAGGENNNYAINLPISGETLGLNFIMGHMKDKVLNFRLAAMEDSGNGRIISQPRIMTLDNNTAEISTGHAFYFPNAIQSGQDIVINTDTTTNEQTIENVSKTKSPEIPSKTAETKLTVTPHIISDNQIKLYIEINRETPDYSYLERETPELLFLTRKAKTVLIINDGETAVIGGMALTGIDNSSQSIPWLSRIPIIGWLFKNKRKISEYEELLVFITPHIIQPPDYAQSEEKRR